MYSRFACWPTWMSSQSKSVWLIKKFENLEIAEWLDISLSNLFRSQFLAYTSLVCACGTEGNESSLKEICSGLLLLLDLVVNWSGQGGYSFLGFDLSLDSGLVWVLGTWPALPPPRLFLWIYYFLNLLMQSQVRIVWKVVWCSSG